MSKVKKHFAESVRIPVTPRETKDNNANNSARLAVNAETNSQLRMVKINREVFRKTPQEKDELKLAKMQHKALLMKQKLRA